MRTAQPGPANEDLRRPVVAKPVDYAAMEPIGDAAYAVLAQQLDYRATPFTPRIEKVASSNATWTVERVTLPTGYDDTSFAVQLFLPTDRRSRSGVIFYLPHSGEFTAPVTTERFDPTAGGIPFDFLLKAGWGLAVIAFDAAYERPWSDERRQSMQPAERARLMMRHWRTRQVAASMEKEYSRERLREQDQETTLLNRLTSIMTSNVSIQMIFEGFAQELKKVADIDWATIALVEGDEVYYMVLSGIIGSAWQHGGKDTTRRDGYTVGVPREASRIRS